MPGFDDALRGYAFPVHQRDGFLCRYCGLDGTSSFASWLSLSWDHLLPKGHRDRDDLKFIVTACMFCNTADNRYFDLAEKRGLRLDGLTPEKLIAQRLPYVEATRGAYRQFWEGQVRPARGGLMDEVVFEARGIGPAPRSTPRRQSELEWRAHLARCARPAGEEVRARMAAAPASVILEIEFFLLGNGKDLDNLAKPVLDTLFAPRPNPNQEGLEEVSGVVFYVDDSAVTRLDLRKTIVADPGEQGARIGASWR